MINRLFYIFLFCILSSPLRAQDGMIKTEIITLAMEKDVDGYFFKSGETILPFAANITGFSLPVPYAGPTILSLRKSEAEFAADPLPAPAATVRLPANCDRILLLCVTTEGKPLQLVPVDISSKTLKPGDYRFFNFSRTRVGVVMEDKKFAINPGKEHIATDGKWDSEVLDLGVQMAVFTGEKPSLAYSSVWGHRPGKRNFIFLFDGKHASTPLQINRFFDFAVTPAAASGGTPPAP